MMDRMCVACGKPLPTGSQPNKRLCNDCRAERKRARYQRWVKEQPEKRKKTQSRWYQENKEINSQRSLQWQQEHPERFREINLASHRRKHKERVDRD